MVQLVDTSESVTGCPLRTPCMSILTSPQRKHRIPTRCAYCSINLLLCKDRLRFPAHREQGRQRGKIQSSSVGLFDLCQWCPRFRLSARGKGQFRKWHKVAVLLVWGCYLIRNQTRRGVPLLTKIHRHWSCHEIIIKKPPHKSGGRFSNWHTTSGRTVLLC
jgi:hypothetical protein